MQYNKSFSPLFYLQGPDQTISSPQLQILYLPMSANAFPRGNRGGTWGSNKTAGRQRPIGQRLRRVKILSSVLFCLVPPSGPINSLFRALESSERSCVEDFRGIVDRSKLAFLEAVDTNAIWTFCHERRRKETISSSSTFRSNTHRFTASISVTLNVFI